MISFRPIAVTDIDPLTRLVATVEEADEGLSRPAAEIRASLETALADLSQTGWLAQVDPGQVVGYNYGEMVPGPALNFWLRGAVQPNWRGQGLGRALVQRSWAEMQRRCAQIGSPAAWVNAWAYQNDQPRCRLLACFGLQPDHIYHELEIAADRVEPRPSLPPGVIIRGWENRYCEAAAALRNRAFAQNWGYQPTSAAALHRRFETARYEPSLSFTAWQQRSGGEEALIGLVHACLGWTRQLRQANEGEVVWVAVAEESRGQGLGRALMLTAMNALRAAGAAVISVSTDNYADRPLLGLYTQLGFTIRKAIVDYRGELQHGPDGKD